MSPELSIVIPCYLKNEELLQLTKSTIHSLREADLPEYELILVDDGTSVFSGYLREEADTYILHPENKGFIQSVNDGMKLARGKYILLTNNDIRAAPNFWTVAKEILDEDDNVISVHPRMCFYEEEMLYGDRTYTTGRERWCQGSFFVIRKTFAMYPEFFMGTGGGYEDWYFFCELKDEGWRTAYTTKTCFQHKDSSTTTVIGEESKFHAENTKLFADRFGLPPEEYYIKLYPDQMSMEWRREFTRT